MKKAVSVFFCFMLCFYSAFAHPGQTDDNGGHYDHSTGEYHFHHGYPAHQHTDGICPYEFDDRTGWNSGTPGASGAYSSSDIQDDYRRGYYDGMTSAKTEEYMNSEDSYNDAYDFGYNAGLEVGYEAGYETGQQNARAEEFENARQSGYDKGYAEGHDAGYLEGHNDGEQKAISANQAKETELYWGIFLALLFGFGFGFWYKHKRLQKEIAEEQKKYNELHSTYSRYANIAQKELSAYRTTLAERNATVDRLRKDQPSKHISSPIPTFQCWPSGVHKKQSQFERYQRSKSEDMRIIGTFQGRFVVQGASGNIYETSLDTCTCPDFTQNLRKKAPCKHIYFVARYSGIDVDALFQK